MFIAIKLLFFEQSYLLKLHSWEASRSRTRILHHTKQNCFLISIPLFLRISFYCVLKLVFFNNIFRIQNCFYWMHKHNNQRWVHWRPATPYEKNWTILVTLNWNLVLLQCSGWTTKFSEHQIFTTFEKKTPPILRICMMLQSEGEFNILFEFIWVQFPL